MVNAILKCQTFLLILAMILLLTYVFVNLFCEAIKNTKPFSLLLSNLLNFLKFLNHIFYDILNCFMTSSSLLQYKRICLQQLTNISFFLSTTIFFDLIIAMKIFSMCVLYCLQKHHCKKKLTTFLTYMLNYNMLIE